MAGFLVDVNLPYYFSLWKDETYTHLYDINDSWTDKQVWEYARENGLTIITKDTDFYNLVLLSEPPPKVIHLRIGNMKIQEMHDFLNKVWQEVMEMNKSCKLVTVYHDRIEGLEEKHS